MSRGEVCNMQKSVEFACAGNLEAESEEILRMYSSDEDINVFATNTVTCNSFMTIYCC